MRKYELIEAMTFRDGRFLLNDEQMRRRRYVVNVIDGNLVEPRTEISFKRGEIVCTDAGVPKALEHKMRPVEEIAPEQPEVEAPLTPSADAEFMAQGEEEQPQRIGKKGGKRS